MLQFNVVWCIHSRREIVLTIQSDNGKQGYKVGGKKYCRPKVVLSRQSWRPIWHRLDSETPGILSSQRALAPCSSSNFALSHFCYRLQIIQEELYREHRLGFCLHFPDGLVTDCQLVDVSAGQRLCHHVCGMCYLHTHTHTHTTHTTHTHVNMHTYRNV